MFESVLKRIRNDSKIRNFCNTFWFNFVIDRLENAGFYIPFEFIRTWRTDKYYDLEDFFNDTQSISTKILEFLDRCEKKPKKDIYNANNEYLSIREFFLNLIKSISFNKQNGYWTNLHSRNEHELRASFRNIFGFYSLNMRIEWILTPDEFIKRINEILKELGYADFSILANGRFRYVGVTAEAEEIKRAYSLLTLKNYDNVIECLDSIDDTKNSDIEKKENTCLDRCRYALESFYKRLLLNHGINILYDGRPTENGTINPVAETVRKNIGAIFSFPSYSKNMITGFNKLIEASKNIVSGLADDGGAHGKSNPPKVDMDTVKATESFLILLINTLLPFEK